MRRRVLLNLALLALLLVLAALMLWQPAPPRLSALDPDTVRRVAIESDGERIVLARRADGWWLLEPRELPGHADQIEPLLRLPALSWSARYDAADVDLAAAGLAPPRRVLSFDGVRFELGAIEPLGTRRYLRHDGAVYLVNERVSALAAAPWWGFVRPDLRQEARAAAEREAAAATDAPARAAEPVLIRRD